MQVKTFWPRCAPSACDRPTMVVDLPSPSGVGVMAVTSMYLPFGRLASRSRTSRWTLALYGPNSSRLAWLQADFLGDLQNRLEFAGLRDVDVAGDGREEFQLGGDELDGWFGDFLGGFGGLGLHLGLGEFRGLDSHCISP